MGEKPDQKAPGRALNRCRWVSRSRRVPVPVCGSTKMERFPQISSVLDRPMKGMFIKRFYEKVIKVKADVAAVLILVRYWAK